MDAVIQYVRPKVYNFYLRHLRAAHLPALEDIAKYVEKAVLHTVLATPSNVELNNDFNRRIQLEIYKLSGDINRWLGSQQELVIREVRKSGLKDPRLVPLVRGLNTVQAKSIINTFQVSPYRAQKLAATYRQRRASLIADTETIKWIAVSQRAVWGTAYQQGLLHASARMIWVNSRRSNMCERCLIMNNQPATVDGMFITPEGFGIYSPPLHPHCRCRLRLQGGEW